MYCILVTGIPASGKSTMAGFLAEAFGLPVISKDRIKELMYDTIGFRSREEKVKLGTAAMEIMYDTAEQLMKSGQPFLLENNFENASKAGLDAILDKYAYKAITVILTGDTKIMDTFTANGPQIIVDTTDYSRVDREALVRRIREEMV